MDPNLYRSMACRDVTTLKLFSSDLLVNSTTHQGNTALHVAVQFGIMELVKVIYDGCPSLLARANLRGDTALHMSARSGLVEVVKFLIDNDVPKDVKLRGEAGGASKQLIRVVNDKKDTALHEAVRNGHLEIVKLITEADKEFKYLANNAGETPVYLSVMAGAGAKDTVEQIVNTCQSVDYGGVDGRTALHAAILLDKTAKMLMDKQGRLVTEADNKGWTPLHCAACRGNKAITKDITKHFPDSLDQTDNRGQNFVHIAVRHGQHELIINQMSALQKSWRVENLLCESDIEGNTPLLLASISSNNSIKCLLARDGIVSKKAVVEKNSLADQEDNADEICMHFNLYGFSVLCLGPRHSIFGTQIYNLPSVETTTKEEDVAAVDTMDAKEKLTKRRENGLLVAALILTVTFAAGLAVPGGFQSNGTDQGTAVLSRKPAFKVFAVTNSIAMLYSTLSIFLHFSVIMRRREPAREKELIARASKFTYSAVFLMMTAFISGSYAVLSNSRGLAIAVCVIDSLTFFLGTSMFT